MQEIRVRFDERPWETERCRMAQTTAPTLDSVTRAESLVQAWFGSSTFSWAVLATSPSESASLSEFAARTARSWLSAA